MSKASYRAKQAGHLGVIDKIPHPKRCITLKAYRKWRRRRHRIAKGHWKAGLDLRSVVGQKVEYWPKEGV